MANIPPSGNLETMDTARNLVRRHVRQLRSLPDGWRKWALDSINAEFAEETTKQENAK
jgi:hypothetical protein